jgi:hypothetical protein
MRGIHKVITSRLEGEKKEKSKGSDGPLVHLVYQIVFVLPKPQQEKTYVYRNESTTLPLPSLGSNTPTAPGKKAISSDQGSVERNKMKISHCIVAFACQTLVHLIHIYEYIAATPALRAASATDLLRRPALNSRAPQASAGIRAGGLAFEALDRTRRMQLQTA